MNPKAGMHAGLFIACLLKIYVRMAPNVWGWRPMMQARGQRCIRVAMRWL